MFSGLKIFKRLSVSLSVCLSNTGTGIFPLRSLGTHLLEYRIYLTPSCYIHMHVITLLSSNFSDSYMIVYKHSKDFYRAD